MLSTLVLIVSCGKAKDVQLVYQPQINPIKPKTTKAGFKCTISGESEHKEVFIEVTRKDENVTISFHDFAGPRKISNFGADFEGYALLPFSKMNSDNGSNSLSGEAPLLHQDKKSLSTEGEVTSVMGALSFTEETMTGSLRKKFFIKEVDGKLKITEYTDLAKVDRCEVIEADWI